MKVVYIILLMTAFHFPIVYADELFITFTDADSEIILDGKWSNAHEWKKSSETIITQDNKKSFALRYAHNYEQIFVLIDVVDDISANSLKDKSLLCFEAETTESSIIDESKIYCFEKMLDGNLVTLIKNVETLESSYKKIKNPPNVVATSGLSDQNDRYSKIPHISYEFQIPIDIIGRSNEYNVYVEVFDAETNSIMTWPSNPDVTESFLTNSTEWGKMISPDKSIPEFPSPLIVFAILIVTILVIQLKLKTSLSNII